MGFPDGSVGKEPACDAGDARDMSLIPGSGGAPAGGTATHSNIVAWRIQWTEGPGGLQPIGHKMSDTNEVTENSIDGRYHQQEMRGPLLPQIWSIEETLLSMVSYHFIHWISV